MQEEVEKKTANFAIQTTKLSFKAIYRIWGKYRSHRKEKKAEKKAAKRLEQQKGKRGKQTIKELIGQGDGVDKMDIAKVGLKDFQKTANKYGVDFAVVKDKSVDPPRYTIFFKAKDAKAIDRVMTDYAAKEFKREKKAERTSLLKKLAKFKDIARKAPRKEHEKRKEQER